MKVLLSSLDAVQDFVESVCVSSSKILVSDGENTVNGESITDVLTLHLEKPVSLNFEGEEDIAFLENIDDYIVNE